MTAARPSRPPGMPFVVRQANGSMLLLVVAVPLHTESATPASPANSGSRGVFDHRCMADCCVIVSSVRLDRVHASPLETDYDDGSRVAAADPIPRASRRRYCVVLLRAATRIPTRRQTARGKLEADRPQRHEPGLWAISPSGLRSGRRLRLGRGAWGRWRSRGA